MYQEQWWLLNRTLFYYPPINRLQSLNQHLFLSVLSWNRCNIRNSSTATQSISNKEMEELQLFCSSNNFSSTIKLQSLFYHLIVNFVFIFLPVNNLLSCILWNNFLVTKFLMWWYCLFSKPSSCDFKISSSFTIHILFLFPLFIIPFCSCASTGAAR